ncbi:MAG TPA: hypothetical protein VEA63_03395 [Opitutus sp.]|nr:hypothetical protein [Opitutus sp.]
MMGSMSFSCPFYVPDGDYCLRLKTDCVPGRRGCVLPANTQYAVPAEVRVRAKEEEKRQANRDVLPPWPPTGKGYEGATRA